MDNSSNSKDEAYAMFDAFDALIRKQPPASALVLCDFENCYHDVSLLGQWKRASPEHELHTKKTATMGVSGGFRIAMAAYRFFARLRGVQIDTIMRDFSSEEAAIAWLIE